MAKNYIAYLGATSMLRRHIWQPILHFFLLLLIFNFFLSSATLAQSNTSDGFETWLEGVRQEARSKGVSEKTISEALSSVKPLRRIIERDRNQAEFKLTLEQYSSRVVSDKNIKTGRAKSDLHKSLLENIERRFGVQRRFILAIWGIETRFGFVEANVPVIPAVSTLAFDRRRSKYFRAQIFAVLEMLDRGLIDLKNLKGSWAGAMGQPQFMPTSYLAYAVDFDGDGRRDIWNNIGDTLGSIANYLKQHGWNNNLTWGREVSTPNSILETIGPAERRAAPGCRARTSQRLSLKEWGQYGIRRAGGDDLPTRDILASLVLPDGSEGRRFLVYSNYQAIMAYNCAHHYAVTVGLLSDKLWTKI
jgi:membrane-bound lytic murein transglycosylase B